MLANTHMSVVCNRSNKGWFLVHASCTRGNCQAADLYVMGQRCTSYEVSITVLAREESTKEKSPGNLLLPFKHNIASGYVSLLKLCYHRAV